MNKIRLTAFGGKLKSEPMDWDVRWSRDIRLVLDVATPRTFSAEGPLPTDLVTCRQCVFEESGYVINGAREYRLVNL